MIISSQFTRLFRLGFFRAFYMPRFFRRSRTWSDRMSVLRAFYTPNIVSHCVFCFPHVTLDRRHFAKSVRACSTLVMSVALKHNPYFDGENAMCNTRHVKRLCNPDIKHVEPICFCLRTHMYIIISSVQL